jgi:hypothetical protein
MVGVAVAVRCWRKGKKNVLLCLYLIYSEPHGYICAFVLINLFLTTWRLTTDDSVILLIDLIHDLIKMFFSNTHLTSILFLLYLFTLNLRGFWQYVRFGLYYSWGVVLAGF